MSKSASEKFQKGITVQTIVSISTAILQVVVFAILSRLLSKAEFGYYAALMGITMIFMGISDAGIGSAVIQQKKLSKKYISTAFTTSIVFGGFMSVAFFLLASYLANIIVDNTLTVPMRLMAIPLFLQNLNGVGVALLRRDLQFGLLGKMKIISYSISAIIAIFGALIGWGLYAMVVLFVLDATIYTLLVYVRVGFPYIGFGHTEFKSVFSYGGWLTLGVIMSSIANQVDKLVLGKWLTVERLGAYNRPSGFISNIIGQINTIFDGVLFPILSEFQDSKEKFRDIFYRSYLLLSTLGILIACVLFFNSKLIITIFFGEQWNELVGVLQIVSLSAIFMLNNTLADCFFRSFNLVKAGFFIRSFGVLLTLSFLYIGSKYDVLGVAIAVFVANFITVAIKLLYLVWKSNADLLKVVRLGFFAWKPSVPIIIIGVLITAVFPVSFVGQIAIAIILISVVIIELLFFPNYVGDGYMDLMYSKLQPIRTHIIGFIRRKRL